MQKQFKLGNKVYDQRFSLYSFVTKTKFKAQVLLDGESWEPKIASEKERKSKWGFHTLSSNKPVLLSLKAR